MKSWITTSSTNVISMVNSVNAACDHGFVPTDLYFLKNPDVVDAVDRATEVSTRIIEAYGSKTPNISITHVEDELDFAGIRDHVNAAVVATKEAGGESAVDITPGRKFMSAISFYFGLQYEADHIYYFYIEDDRHHGLFYPAIPRSAVDLIDFMEEI